MESRSTQICPWCQTEIVWDPELGPERQCPHCLNDLGAYRTIKLKLKTGQSLSLNEEDDDEESLGDFDLEDSDLADEPDERLDDYDDNAPEYRDEFDVLAEQCADAQEEAPECGNCKELMLLAGRRTVSSFEPAVPALIGRPFMPETYRVDVYMCPSCFKTDEFLSPDDRRRVIEAFKKKDS